jgi:hypothetical protein
MDRAYEGNEARQFALDLGLTLFVLPLLTRVAPWTYSKAWDRRSSEIQRLFRRLKGFRRIFSRFDKLDTTSWRSCASHSWLKHSVSVNEP